MKTAFLLRKSFLPLLLILSMTGCSRKNNDPSLPQGVKGTVTDVDGNVYGTISIGNQVWMTENLKTTHYRNQDAIPQVADSATWHDLETDGMCWYADDPGTYAGVYGGLYNWFAVDDPRGLAPVGWHVPTQADWVELIDYLGGTAVAGGKMKPQSSQWSAPNTGATNSSGFSGLPGGYRHTNGHFEPLGLQGYWWHSTERNETYAYYNTLFYNYAVANTNNNKKTDAMSIRCVKD